MAEGARLESVYTLIRIEGSNPSLSAKPTFAHLQFLSRTTLRQAGKLLRLAEY